MPAREEITQATADAITDELLSTSKMFVVTKDSVPTELAFRVVFDGARLVGVEGLPSGAQAHDEYFQGIGPVLLVPKGWKQKLSPRAQVRIIAHECTHGGQMYADPKMLVWYVQHTEARGAYEEEAFGSGFELDYLCDAVVPARLEDLDHAERQGYALTPADLELVRGLGEQRVTSIAHGVIATRTGRLVARRLFQLQPGALHPDAVARILVGSPGLLS